MMPYPNGMKFTVKFAFMQGSRIPNLKEIPLAVHKIQLSKALLNFLLAFALAFFVLFFFLYTLQKIAITLI